MPNQIEFRERILLRLLVIFCLAVGLLSHVQAQTLVSAGSVWKYRDDGSNQGTVWRALNFNDASWSSGAAQLGYGDGDEATVVSFGPNSSSKYVTTYFRRAFVVDDAGILDSALALGVLRDDGAVVYLNGREVFRSNMPGGTISYNTTASGTVPRAEETAFQEEVLPPGDLVLGNNVLAVEIHQANLTSSDISFDLRLNVFTGWPGADLTRGPYLQMISPTKVVVRWRTDVAVGSVLRYGTSPGSLLLSNRLTAATTEHEVEISGLLPGTRYYYSAETLTGVLAAGPEYYLVTSPAPGSTRPLRIWVLGDSGTGSSSARSVRDAYLAYTGNRHTDAVLMLGDNAYENGTDSEMQSAIYNMYPMALRSSPLWPALGNHDTGQTASPPSSLPHFVNWTLPASGEIGGRSSGTEKYFSFNMGNVHFVCLDSMSSDRSPSGAMVDWVRKDLALNTLEWVIAYWHHAPYSRGPSNSDTEPNMVSMRTSVVPVLEEGGVDLVLGGHSHVYERSFLIDGHYGVASTFNASMKIDGGDGKELGDGPYYKLGGLSPHQGTVYAVVGSSAKSESGSLNHPVMYYGTSALGSMVLDIDGGRLEARFLDSTGNIRDEFTIQKTFPPFVTITAQPQGQAVELGTPVQLSVRAISQNPISYQWRKDGVSREGFTDSTYEISGIREEDEGVYDVVVSDINSSVISAPARVSLRIPPMIVYPAVSLEVVEGGRAVLSIGSAGTLPMGYRWRNGGATITNYVLDSHECFHVIDPVRLLDAGIYTVVLTNSVFWQPGILSPRATLTVLTDSDGDLLPDVWEDERGLDKNDPSDAIEDLDGDGHSNGEEYEAGTDPSDALDALRIMGLTVAGEEEGEVVLEFKAASNKTYTVEYLEGIADSGWKLLEEVVAVSTNRVKKVRDPVRTPSRFYRLVTPR